MKQTQPTTLLRTYLIENAPPELLLEFEERGAVFVKTSNHRTVLVTEIEPPACRVVKWFEGNQSQFVLTWVDQNALDALDQEYLSGGPASSAKQKKAIDAFVRAKDTRTKVEVAYKKVQERWKKDRAKYEHEVVQSKKKEYEASCNLVLAFGRGPVVIKGVTWDPGYVKGTVYYSPRKVMT